MFRYLKNALHNPQSNLFCLGFLSFPVWQTLKKVLFFSQSEFHLKQLSVLTVIGSVSSAVLWETRSELLQLLMQESWVCLCSLCWPRDSRKQDPNNSIEPGVQLALFVDWNSRRKRLKNKAVLQVSAYVGHFCGLLRQRQSSEVSLCMWWVTGLGRCCILWPIPHLDQTCFQVLNFGGSCCQEGTFYKMKLVWELTGSLAQMPENFNCQSLWARNTGRCKTSVANESWLHQLLLHLSLCIDSSCSNRYACEV